VRQRLQQFFGNAGRGLVFPYQVAQSNAPPDILSSSNTGWDYNRLAHPEIPIIPGVSGFVIRTNNPSASIDFSLRNNEEGAQHFNKMKFFLDNNSSWLLQANNNPAPYLLKKEDGDSSVYRQVSLDQPSDGFTLSALPSDYAKEFYGVSLENSNPGVLYHNIGVNGIRYEQYNNASIFWEQLASLHADLYIVSLGTNEAQKKDFDNESFQKQVSIFLERIKLISPNASVLICTSADSFRGRRSNPVLREINISLNLFGVNHSIPIWDLYRITNGYGSAYNWARHGLMNNDHIHFTAEGYRLQGNLLFNALAKGYNNYTASLNPSKGGTFEPQ
jgi:lysophospholipase L1-like esterase